MSGNVKPGVWGAQCFAGSDSGFLLTCQKKWVRVGPIFRCCLVGLPDILGYV